MADKKRKSFELADKLSIISELESGKKQIQIAKELNISKSTVQQIWKDKDKIKELCGTYNLHSRKLRHSEYPTVEAALLEWYKIQRTRNLSISGQLLAEKAREIAVIQNIQDFKGSDGWVSGFKQRHGLVDKKVAGEEAAVDLSPIDAWLANVWPSASASYAPANIFNCDETALFFRAMPQRTLEFKNKSCHGGKESKERLTVLLCVNADGSEKLRPLVIGKSQKPRCFKNIRDLSSLPVDYAANRSAWMTTTIFSGWLKKLDRKMTFENRKILLVMDNAPPHVAAETNLRNVKVLFLPPNATSVVQPLDRGIINSLKAKYRGLLVKKMIARLDANQTAKIDVLEAIENLGNSWNMVTSDCIKNCFKNSKLVQLPCENSEEVVNIDLPPGFSGDFNLSQSDFEEYVNVDYDVPVYEIPSIDEIARSHENSSSVYNELDYSDDEEEVVDRPTISNSEALELVKKLRYYSMCTGVNANGLDKLELEILNLSLSSLKQTTIDSYFKKF